MSSLVAVSALATQVVGAVPCADDIPGLADAELTASVHEWGRIKAAAETAIALHAADMQRRSARELGAAGLAQRVGAKDAAGLVQQLTGSSLGAARQAVRVGELLETANAAAPGDVRTEPGAVPPSLEALAGLAGAWDAPLGVCVRRGWLSADQADAVQSGLGAPRDAEAAPEWRRAVLSLIQDCWEASWTAEDLRRAAKQARASLDRTWAHENAHRLHELRSFRRAVRPDGMVKYDLLLDPEADARVWTPLFRRLAPRLGGPRFLTVEEQQRAAGLEADPRSNEQLLADELVALITAGVNRAAAGDGKGKDRGFGQFVPRVNVTVTTTELKKAKDAAAALSRHHAGDHSRCPAGAPSAGPPGIATANPARSGTLGPPGERGYSGGRGDPGGRGDDAGACPGPDVGIAWLDGHDHPISALDALAALCDGGYVATLFDETGQTIDVTKDERTFSPRQRRALAARDGGCLMPGCTMPASGCEAHHVNHWGLGHHTTEVRDGVLLCRFHHLNLHHHGAHIERRGATYWLHWPGREPQRLVSTAPVRRELALNLSGSTIPDWAGDGADR